MLENISFNPIFLVDPIFFDDPIFLGESILKKKRIGWTKESESINTSNNHHFSKLHNYNIKQIIIYYLFLLEEQGI